MASNNSPGAWAAVSSYGYPVDAPDSVFTEVTPFSEPCRASLVAGNIKNPADAFVLSAAKDMYSVCEMMLFLLSADKQVVDAMSKHEAICSRLRAAMDKAEGKRT